jgi:hypothetical protein
LTVTATARADAGKGGQGCKGEDTRAAARMARVARARAMVRGTRAMARARARAVRAARASKAANRAKARAMMRAVRAREGQQWQQGMQG